MSPADLLDSLGMIGDAPEGIKRLRQLILQLAVRGRLVPQDPNDEPVDLFINAIDSRKEAEGTRTSPTATLHNEGAHKWAIPVNWKWVPFGKTHINFDGVRVPLRAADRKQRQGSYSYYGASGVIDSIDEYLFDGEYLLIGEDGANLVNRSTPIAFLAYGQFWVNNHAHVLGSVDTDSLRYLAVFMNAIDLKPFLTGIAQPKLNQRKMNVIPTAFPPLSEQRRIVVKVDELMALLDELEQARDERDAHRAAFRDSALSALQNAEDSEAVEAAWSRIATNLADCITDPADIAPLRQTILQLAVRGRLVPQDPEDEPVDKNVHIEGDSSLLGDQKKRKSKALPELNNQEVKTTAPLGWAWKRLGNVCRLSRGIDLPLKNRKDGNIPVFGANGIVGYHNEAKVRAPGVVTGRSGSIGNVHKIYEDYWPLNTALYVERFFCNDPEFIALLLKSVGLQRFSSFSAVPTLNRNTAHLEPVMVPPPSEQRRIVMKVDELMAICDELEQRLNEAKTHQSAFAAAAVHHLDLAQETQPY